MDVTSLRKRLVVFVGDRTKIASVCMELRRTFDVECVADPGDIAETQPDALVLLGEAAWGARPPGLEQVPVVAVISPDALRRRMAKGALPPAVLIQGQDDWRLPEVLRRLLTPPLLTERGQHALGTLPPLLRRSLQLVLEHPVPTLVEAVEALAWGKAPFAHTRRHFAERFACSPDHLTRLARGAGLRWADQHRHALYLRMRHHRLLTGDTWAHTFVRFGINAPSAGTGFVKRITGGMTPCAAEAVRFEEVRDCFFDSLDGGAAPTRRVG